MDRIRKIVERGKRDQAGKTSHTNASDLAKRETIASNKPVYKYSDTKLIDVPNEVLIKNRIIAGDATDPRATRFQVLRTKVLQQMRKKKWNSLAISAPTPGAGKSVVAANLALSIAMEGNQSVLLVDMDLRKPSIHRYFGFKPELGIHDYLDGSSKIEDILVNPGLDRLVVLPGRKGVLNSSDQISTPLVQNLVKELKNRYQSRIVIFDLPPILVSDDVMVFLPYVDCSMLVVEAGKNTPKDIESSLETIGSNPLLGTVLNKSEQAEKNFIY